MRRLWRWGGLWWRLGIGTGLYSEKVGVFGRL